MLLVIISVSALQVAVTFMHPSTSNFVYAGASGRENQVTPGALTTLNVTQVQTKVVTQGTTQTLVITSSQTVTDSITLPPQTIPPDYTPVGIAIVVAVGMLALLVMFLKRRR